MAEQTPTEVSPDIIPGTESSVDKKEVAITRFWKSVNAIADAAGLLEVLIGQVPSSSTWFIERLLVECNAGAPTVFTMYETYVGAPNRRTFTPAGNNDEADSNSPIYFPPSSNVIGSWVGAAAGDIGYCIVLIRQET
jgi:hypothetical protein